MSTQLGGRAYREVGAVRPRSAPRMPTRTVTHCPTCGSRVGERCTMNGKPNDQSHVSRKRLAARIARGEAS